MRLISLSLKVVLLETAYNMKTISGEDQLIFGSRSRWFSLIEKIDIDCIRAFKSEAFYFILLICFVIGAIAA